MTETGRRLPWVDVLRIIGCLCVLCLHIEYKGGLGGNRLLALIDFFGSAGFMLFFMVSGMLALSSPRPLDAFLYSKLRRIVVPTVVWTLVYLLANVLAGRLDWMGLVHRVALMPLEPQVPQFWYLYVMMGIYLLTPVLSHWLAQASRRQVEFYLCVWLVTLFLPFLPLSKPSAITHPLFYFQGYLGVVLLGYYFHRYIAVAPFRWWLWLLALVLVTLPLWVRVTGLRWELISGYLSPNMLGLSCILFLLVRCIRWPSFSHKVLSVLGQASYGIYLMHMVVIRFFVLPVVEPLHLNYCVGIPLALALVLLISFVLVWLFSHLKYAWVLGCSLKKA